MSDIELEIAEQEFIRNDAVDKGAKYCSDCGKRSYKSDCQAENKTVYRNRMDLGNKLWKDGLSMLEVENKITAEYPCNQFIENIRRKNEINNCKK